MNLPNSKYLSPNFARHFDAHIYFDSHDKEFIENLRGQALQKFQGNEEIFIGHPIDRPIGPHPKAMMEFNFSRNYFTDMTLWLMHTRGHLAVLIHELSDDDYRDHTQGAIWLGEIVPLKFDLLKNASQERP